MFTPLASADDLAGIASLEAIGQPVVSVAGGAADIVDAGGIASEEAFGAPTVSPQGAEEPLPGFGGGVRPQPRPSAPWQLHGAGGIASGEVFGCPTVLAGERGKARRRREERALLGLRG